jgi:hypothetical protein
VGLRRSSGTTPAITSPRPAVETIIQDNQTNTPRSLAYAEMRLILAKILFHFDLELVQPGQDWMSGQRVFALWEKPALEVRLTPVKR